jgi:Mg2+-importing ATPase
VSAVIITAIVVLGSAVNFTQSFRSQRVLERLQGSVAPMATALRDGEWCEIPRRQLVPGVNGKALGINDGGQIVGWSLYLRPQ